MNFHFLNSFHLAAKASLRRHSCAKRAERILCKLSSSGWSVSITTDKLQAVQQERQDTGCFTHRQNWLCFEVLSNGECRLVSGHHTIVVTPCIEVTGVGAVLINECQTEISPLERSPHQKKIMTVLQKIYVRAITS